MDGSHIVSASFVSEFGAAAASYTVSHQWIPQTDECPIPLVHFFIGNWTAVAIPSSDFPNPRPFLQPHPSNTAVVENDVEEVDMLCSVLDDYLSI